MTAQQKYLLYKKDLLFSFCVKILSCIDKSYICKARIMLNYYYFVWQTCHNKTLTSTRGKCETYWVHETGDLLFSLSRKIRVHVVASLL